jgi:hypothetical protein
MYIPSPILHRRLEEAEARLGLAEERGKDARGRLDAAADRERDRAEEEGRRRSAVVGAVGVGPRFDTDGLPCVLVKLASTWEVG